MIVMKGSIQHNLNLIMITQHRKAVIHIQMMITITYTPATSKDSDPYDVNYYENGDDFAEEWAEEFGSGDSEDGYEDAYDYWESESDEGD